MVMLKDVQALDVIDMVESKGHKKSQKYGENGKVGNELPSVLTPLDINKKLH